MQEAVTYTNADFENLSWHDRYLWGFEFRISDPENDDWASDLSLDIDFHLEGARWIDGRCESLLTAATLVFHGVTDPKISIDWGPSGFQNLMHGVSIDRIEREQIQNRRLPTAPSEYKWRIPLNWPEGEISFGASGFTQMHRGEPIRTFLEHLTWRERNPGAD